MRILVIGATGRTGRQIAAELLGAGHAVRAFARSASPDTVPAGAEPWAGDVLEPEVLDAAMSGVDAVVTALSIPRASGSPFAQVTGPPDLHSRSTRLILEAMRAHDVRRLVKLSAQGVGDSAPRAGLLFRLLVWISNLRTAFEDHARADALIAESDRAWTILRPPVLSDGPPTGQVRVGPRVSTSSFTRLPRADVASSVVQALEHDRWVHRAVSLAPARRIAAFLRLEGDGARGAEGG